jgi:hypothetical protein
MNNKILISVGGIVLVLWAFLIFSSPNSEIKNPLEEKNINIPKPTLKTGNNKEEKKVFVEKKEIKKNITQNKSEGNNFNVHNNAGNYDRKNNEFIFDEKSFNNFADENNLEEVGSIDENTKIYAKNLPVRNEFAPPMPPLLVKLNFKKETKVIPLKSGLVNANKKIYITNKNGKKIEVKEIDTNKLTSFAPPAIGQN